MSQGRKIAARADRPARGDDRDDSAIEALDEQLDRGDVRAREPLGERVRAQEHRRSNDLVRIRLANAACMAPEKPHLELFGLVLGDMSGHETAESGIHAVGVLAVNRIDKLPCGTHPIHRSRGHLCDSVTECDIPYIGESEIFPGQGDRPRHELSLVVAPGSPEPLRAAANTSHAVVLSRPHPFGMRPPCVLELIGIARSRGRSRPSRASHSPSCRLEACATREGGDRRSVVAVIRPAARFSPANGHRTSRRDHENRALVRAHALRRCPVARRPQLVRPAELARGRAPRARHCLR